MECINEIGSFHESAQQGHDNACCAFAENEQILQLLHNTGIKSSVLHNKLNPAQPHRLAADDLVLFTKDSGNYSIVNSLLLNLDMISVHVDRNIFCRAADLKQLHINLPLNQFHELDRLKLSKQSNPTGVPLSRLLTFHLKILGNHDFKTIGLATL
ncbi:MAG: hypothetical protein ACJAZP_003862 [Psychromonas sp.]|jgi:hypothetical protein|uniref:phage regulatory CII family protein n=1 Tax=Psychromonas sp. TaxID=1884585 RepID=UPI0039E63666